MAQASTVQIALAAVTTAASLLSLIGSAFILFCYAILPFDGHFRHMLIMNLAMSDFLHALNEGVSATIILARKKSLNPDAACVFNGFAGQVTSQATDCAVLAITVSTVYVITRRTTIPLFSEGKWRYGRIALLICSIWAFPFFTGFLAFGMGLYVPVTGSWCWITSEPAYLRYALNHGWRLSFIVIEVALYIYLDVHLRRQYGTIKQGIPSEPWGDGSLSLGESSHDSTLCPPIAEPPLQTIHVCQKQDSSDNRSCASSCKLTHKSAVNLLQDKARRILRWFSHILSPRETSQMAGTLSSDARHQAANRALLLNAYPVAYIILWLPDIANRLIEATGHSITAMQFLQVARQLVGLANAWTYGWNERVGKQLKERFSKRQTENKNASLPL